MELKTDNIGKDRGKQIATVKTKVQTENVISALISLLFLLN